MQLLPPRLLCAADPAQHDALVVRVHLVAQFPAAGLASQVLQNRVLDLRPARGAVAAGAGDDAKEQRLGRVERAQVAQPAGSGGGVCEVAARVSVIRTRVYGRHQQTDVIDKHVMMCTRDGFVHRYSVVFSRIYAVLCDK